MTAPPSSGNGAAGGRPARLAGPRWLDRYVLAVVLGFGAFVLGPSLLGLRTLISVNLLSTKLPWRADGLTANGHQFCTTDTVDSVMPGIAYTREQLFSGHLGNWQALVGGGSPLASLPNLGVLDPLSLPYFLMPLWLAPAFVMLLQLVAAIGGTFLFVRRLGASRAAGLLAGLIYATSGFMVVWSNWPQARTAALVPLLLWSIERLLQRVGIRDALVVALVVAAMLLGGFPQVTGFALYLAAGYLVVRVLARYRSQWRAAWRPIGLAVTGLALGTGLAMVQLLPFVDQLRVSDLAYRAGNETSVLPVASLITAVVPNANGSCIYPVGYYGVNNQPIEAIAYIGAAALVLAVAGAACGMTYPRSLTRSARGYLSASVVVILIIGWFSVSVRLGTNHLPVFAGNFIGRIRVLLGFCLAVLAGLGFEALVRARARRSRAPEQSRTRSRRLAWPAVVWTVAVVTGAAVTGAVVLVQARNAAISQSNWMMLRRDLVVPGLLGLLTVIALLSLWRRSRILRIAALLVVPLLVMVQSASFFHTMLPGDSPDEFYPVTPIHQFLAANLGSDRFGASGTMFAETSLYYGLRTPTGHTFQADSWTTLLQAVDPSVMQSPTDSVFTSALNEKTIGTSPILDRMGVKYFVLPPDQVAGRAVALPPATGSVAASATTSASCSMASQPLRGLSIGVTQALAPASPNGGLTFQVTVRSGARTITSGRFLDAPVPAGTVVPMALAGDDLPTGGVLTATVTVQGASGPAHLDAVAGGLDCAPILPQADNLKTAYADPSSIVYQRLTAMPRIRWASSSTVISDAGARTSALAAGVPAGTVVLNAAGPATSGKPAAVNVATDNGDHIVTDVNAQGAGYLVIADAMQQPGWSVTVDGKPAHLVDADEAMVAVALPGGQHRVAFVYSAPGQLTGAAVTAVVALLMLGLWLWARRRGGEQEAVPGLEAAGRPGRGTSLVRPHDESSSVP